jgi:hypothetical protein
MILYSSGAMVISLWDGGIGYCLFPTYLIYDMFWKTDRIRHQVQGWGNPFTWARWKQLVTITGFLRAHVAMLDECFTSTDTVVIISPERQGHTVIHSVRAKFNCYFFRKIRHRFNRSNEMPDCVNLSLVCWNPSLWKTAARKMSTAKFLPTYICLIIEKSHVFCYGGGGGIFRIKSNSPNLPRGINPAT